MVFEFLGAHGTVLEYGLWQRGAQSGHFRRWWHRQQLRTKDMISRFPLRREFDMKILNLQSFDLYLVVLSESK